jgi:ribonucleoside-diphosphate reductase alpha chain
VGVGSELVSRRLSSESAPVGGSRVPALFSHGQTSHGRYHRRQRHAEAVSPARPSPPEKLEAVQWSKAGSVRDHAGPSKAERGAEGQGCEGEMCGKYGNFTLVHNGTCMKCDTCGNTTGCS